MKTFHFARWIAVITMIAMLLSGCSSSDSETKNWFYGQPGLPLEEPDAGSDPCRITAGQPGKNAFRLDRF